MSLDGGESSRLWGDTCVEERESEREREREREREKVSGDTFKGAYTMCTSFGELLQKLVGWFIWLL